MALLEGHCEVHVEFIGGPDRAEYRGGWFDIEARHPQRYAAGDDQLLGGVHRCRNIQDSAMRFAGRVDASLAAVHRSRDTGNRSRTFDLQTVQCMRLVWYLRNPEILIQVGDQIVQVHTHEASR